MASLAQLTDQEFSREKIELIKRTIAAGASDDELQLFLYTAKKTGLDPLTRQIYAIKRWRADLGREVMTIQTGIDGFRVTADRTGKLAGITDPVFDSESEEYPKRASVTVKKLLDGGTIADFTATARWSEYVQTGKDKQSGKPYVTGMWKKMPYLMLGKCAEALALRKAFPADLSGVYTTEEMAQADNQAQGDAVHAEVERQKATFTPTPGAADVKLAEVVAPKQESAPPELDWSYQQTTGILICRIVSVASRKRKKGEGEYLTISVNGKVGGKNPEILTYFHSTHREALKAATGKIAKLETEVKGDFANVLAVLEIDGEKVAPHVDPVDSHESKARLLASALEFTDEELKELHTRWCKGSWEEVLQKLEDEKVRRATMEGDPA